jgi:CRISPR/Cas system CSM-associated protein Csm3 (group 7 of RAMP superfamily)
MNAGYEFVPLPKRVHRIYRPEAVHDRRAPGTLVAILSLRFVTEQPIHVGAGFKKHVDGKVVRQATLVRGRPGLPGASMKGVLRARYEGITRSCVVFPLQGFHSIRSSSRPDIKQARLGAEARSADVFRQEDDAGRRLCPACALFGRMSQRSRVTLTDFATREELPVDLAQIPEQFSPNLHHVGRARPVLDGAPGQVVFEVDPLHGRKFAVGQGPVVDKPRLQYVEVIPAGSTLHGTLRAHNALPSELGGLLVALGFHPRSALKIGGGKAHGFGRIRLQALEEARVCDSSGRPVPLDGPGLVDAFERSEDHHADGQRRLVQIHQGDC